VLFVLQEAYRLQLRCFLGLIQEQRHLPSLKQLLKLYTTISLPKLASLMDLDEPTLRSQLILLKVWPHASRPLSLGSSTYSAVLAWLLACPAWPSWPSSLHGALDECSSCGGLIRA
jgi:hypothetical protein